MGEAWGLLIFLGAGLALLLAAGGAMGGKLPMTLVGLYALAGLLLAEFFLTHAAGFTADMGSHPRQTLVFLWIRCAKYSLGPLFYAFYLDLATYDPPTLRGMRAHFLPQAAAWLLSLIYFGASVTGSGSFGMLRTVMGICTDASLAHLLVYLGLAILAARSAGDPRTRRIAVAAGSWALAVAGLLVLYLSTKWKGLETGALCLVALAVIGLFLALQVWPDAIRRHGLAARHKVYQRSALAGLDTGLLGRRLQEEMEQERAYCDELLTLEDLAKRLSVSRNQLSEYLNGVLHTSFNAYVNGFRIAEVKRLLAEEPGRPILSHAYAAGFNSKSVFYETFRRLTGTTPQSFRAGARND